MFSLQAKLTYDKSSMGMKSSEVLKEIQDCMFNLLFVLIPYENCAYFISILYLFFKLFFFYFFLYFFSIFKTILKLFFYLF